METQIAKVVRQGSTSDNPLLQFYILEICYEWLGYFRGTDLAFARPCCRLRESGMRCPHCGLEGHEQYAICPRCGKNPFSHPQYNSSQQNAKQNGAAVGHSSRNDGDATGGVIPYKNPCALTSYYLGIASGLPLIGLLFAIPAIVLGILGLRARSKNPAVKGSVHAGIGIGCGTIFLLFWGAVTIIAIIGLISGPNR